MTASRLRMVRHFLVLADLLPSTPRTGYSAEPSRHLDSEPLISVRNPEALYVSGSHSIAKCNARGDLVWRFELTEGSFQGIHVGRQGSAHILGIFMNQLRLGPAQLTNYGLTMFVAKIPDVNPPLIVMHPEDISARTGESVIFTLCAESLLPINYQWYKDGNPIPFGTNSILRSSERRSRTAILS
jgi:hypothetical protein